MHVTSHEWNLGTCVVYAVEIVATCGGLSLSITGIDSRGPEAVEAAHRFAHDGGNVVDAIDGRGVALCSLSTFKPDAVVVGQTLQLVHIMSHRSTHLHVKRLGKDRFACDSEFKSCIVKRTTVAPIVVDTGNRVVKALQREQVAGVVDVVVEVHTQTVVEPIGFQTDINLAGLLPLNLVVTNVVELSGCRAVEILYRVERCTGSIVADVIVAADVESGTKQQIVDGCRLGEPLFIGDSPSGLDAGEYAPLHSSEAQSVGILTKAAVALHSHSGLKEVEVAIVVVGVCIPCDATPRVAGSQCTLVLTAGRDVGLLVVASFVVLCLRLVVIVCKRTESHSTKGVEIVGTEMLVETQSGVTHDRGLL